MSPSNRNPGRLTRRHRWDVVECQHCGLKNDCNIRLVIERRGLSEHEWQLVVTVNAGTLRLVLL